MSKLTAIAFVGICVSLVAFSCGAQAEPVRKTRAYYEEREEIVWEVPMKEKLVALTFDDGPNPVTTPLILDLLAENEAKATFFVVGKRLERFPDVVRREAREGHEVANHTYSHLYLNSRVNRARLSEELNRTEDRIYGLTGKHCPWFRPPGGFFNDYVIQTARERGYTMVLWSWHQDTKDWSSPGTRRIVDKVFEKI